MITFNNIGAEEEFIPVKKIEENKYIISFDKHFYEKNEDEETIYKWTSFVFDRKTNNKSILDIIYDIINSDVSFYIKNCFNWNGYNVNLSNENQMNYKAAFDLAVNSNEESLPVTFRFYKNNKGESYTFDNLAELKDFYIKMNNHINDTLMKGWKKKDSINESDYKI